MTTQSRRSFRSESGLPFQRIVVFGDSLSDSGNTHKLTKGEWPKDERYYKGAFSNGKVWPLLLGERFGIEVENRAFGGATADNKLVQGKTGYYTDIPVPALADQVDTYLASSKSHLLHAYPRAGAAPKGETLFSIWVGGNDGFLQPEIGGATIFKAIERSIMKLYRAGGRHFLLSTQSDGSPYSAAYNRQLAESMHKLTDTLGNIHFAVADNASLLADIVGDLGKYGFDSLSPCITGIYENESYNPAAVEGANMVLEQSQALQRTASTCVAHPERHVFWDIFHPSARLHQVLADNTCAVVLKRWGVASVKPSQSALSPVGEPLPIFDL
ncbi:carbohydrate esterase family 16 protein [Mixia osmundae IAM 14324]|uniref:SGNH hydrolase-type esterase domain-containing protein n=1 Tax=Mixia osmundae (strain CBS 9802 / IAM 14324 / JCM 22182 / KY 12970) TaxID=764103 RepID=G7DWE1_MIXOS|nr:carbohydrate esterase family 16 protein [Mixia osmundae IAM 14324]KEI37287.1 carbohydrate esterase family 16 protein [Mixia osmundae IAM 14324]GAA94901.1 hypothetical protein E5Q_01556 [Mixia osmundae IAM 14324]